MSERWCCARTIGFGASATRSEVLMACLDRETATSYLRGDLEPQEAERWSAHLASCEACRRVVEEISALIDDVRQDLMRLDVARNERLIHLIDPSNSSNPSHPGSPSNSSNSGGWFNHAWSNFANLRTVSVALASVLVFTIVLLTRGTPVSAAEILQRATFAERSVEQKPGDVLFRVVTVEERRGAARTLVSRRRVEIWRKTGTAVAARRAYNEAGRLVAAEWIDKAGARTLYANGHAPAAAKSGDVLLPARALLLSEQIWRLDLSATTFASLIEGATTARATETSDAIQISYESTSSELIAATLTLAKSDLRAIEQTLQLGAGQDSREFRIAEDRVSHVAPEKVEASMFSVDANLENLQLPTARPAVITPKRLSDSALMGLELEALHLLDGAGALLGEQVNVTRTPTGIVRVEATVDSNARKDDLERALAPLSRSAGVHVTVETFETAAKRDRSRDREADADADGNPTGQTRTPVLREVEIHKDDIPVGPFLRRYFGSSGAADAGVDPAVADQVRTFASRAVEQSRLIVQHAWAMKGLASRYRLDAQRLLDDRARTTWQAMIREHAAAVADHASQLRHLLQPAFFPDESIALATRDTSDATVDDIGVAAERILTLAHTQDDAVRTALVTSTTASSTTTFLQTQQFWHALSELVTLAQRAAAQ
jgi:anti-sigma factor RsiW